MATSTTHHAEDVSPDMKTTMVIEGANADNVTEHQLTMKEVWKNHPALIGWSMYWSMCAIGW